MSSSQDTDNDSARQQQIDVLLKLVVTLTEKCQQPTVCAPAITSDGIYTRAQVEAYLGIGDTTITGWVEFQGLRPIQPGTRFQYYLGSELIAWMVANRNGIDKPKTAKEKNERRKAAIK